MENGVVIFLFYTADYCLYNQDSGNFKDQVADNGHH